MIIETLTTNATCRLTSQVPIGKRSESIFQDLQKYVIVYTTQHLFITSSENYRRHPCGGNTVIHHNTRSLPANLNEFNIFLEEIKHDFSIIGMSETWLKEDNVDLYGINGYDSYHNVRHYRRGGGVCLFVKHNITCNRRDDLSFCYDYVESIFVQLGKNTTGHTKNVILGVMYRPPNQDVELFVNSLKLTVDKITHENKICYLVGDFNLDLFNHDTHSSTGEFLNTCLSSTFVPLINRPTRVNSNTCTLIDNIFCNHYQQLENPG